MFRQLTPSILVSPQISVADVEQARAQGVTVIINNRPDDEEPGQTNGAEIEAAAKAAGIAYAAVPVAHGGFAPWQLDGMAAALAQAGEGKILAYCRSGTRSTLLWALTRARAGDHPAALTEQAASAGYDVTPVRQIMDALAAN
ncbi:protein tyrosine phosphatase family protein [Sphingobium baderi]|uniref:TIGR01244 family sulfur transferase n=1 Tax=Sphingobium baderi TaxID=1332080 RepID=UPI002B40AE1C|nr:TIGR01244 family sulfur transferase [Sphingobium baderi]WRD76234.1 TIGR01244 family sulfur transferase [Sphingobium baderi]